MHHEGYQEAKSECDADIKKANDQAKATLDNLNAQVAKNQQDLTAAQQAIIDKQRELENANSNFNSLRDQYADNVKRLSVRAYIARSPAKPDPGATAAARAGQTGSVDLMPETAASIFDSARRHREDVRLKNECIDLYNAVKDSVNKTGIIPAN